MPEPYMEVAKLVLPAVIGAIGGYAVKFFEIDYQRNKAIKDTWRAQKTTHWLPLLRATTDLEARFKYLGDIFEGKPPVKFTPESISADFRELYMLTRDEIPNLEHVNPNAARQNSDAVQRARTRVCHQLTFAESSVYITAAYLAHAEHAWRALTDDELNIPPTHGKHLLGRLHNVRQALQGASGAGLFLEQQEYMGQAMLLPAHTVLSNIDFRRKLFDLPGWEVFSNLLRFFAEFGPKLPHEIAKTIEALKPLQESLVELRDAPSKQKYDKMRFR